MNLDIGRLEIAMDDALRVRGFERFGDLPRNRQRVVQGNRPGGDAVSRARCASPIPPAPSGATIS